MRRALLSLGLPLAVALVAAPPTAASPAYLAYSPVGDAHAGVNQVTDPDFVTANSGDAPSTNTPSGGARPGSAWQPFEHGFRTGGAPGGKGGIECSNKHRSVASGALQEVVLNQRMPVPFRATLWSRAENVSDTPNSDYSLYLDIVFQDGTPLWGQAAPFATGTHGWQEQTVLLYPDKPVKSVRFYALFRGHSGSVWFNHAALQVFDGATALLDGVPLQRVPYRITTASTRNVPLRTSRLTLTLDRSNGLPLCLRTGSHAFRLHGKGAGVMIRDVGAGSGFWGGLSPLRPVPGGWRQEGEITPLSLRYQVNYRAQTGALDVSGEVWDPTGREREVTVLFALPLPPDGIWWDDLRRSRSVSAPGVYEDTATSGAGWTGRIARYPFSCLQTAGTAFTLAVPPSTPRLVRIAFNASLGLYTCAFDAGLKRGAPPGRFHLLLYTGPPGEGMRSVAARFYRLFPAAFASRSPRAGIWMPFSRISRIPHPEDFGFVFKEGDDEADWDRAHSVYTFRYSEPMSWWMPIPAGVSRDYTVAMQFLNRYAAGQIGNADLRQLANATRISGDRQVDGRYVVSIVDAPWAHGALFIEDDNPDLPDTLERLNRAHVVWNPKVARSMTGIHATVGRSGEYLDSLEGWANTLDFDPGHMSLEKEPLSFDTTTKRPCILEAVSLEEFTRWLSDKVHARGGLLFANATPVRFWWFAPSLDVMGIETNWLNDGHFVPESDETLLYRRTLCYHKPYLLLMNTDFDAFSHDRVERYFQRSLFYGIFPSFFSHDAADNPYWENPHWYERDRDLFRRYIPMIQQLYQAGWEPETGAITSRASVWMERFGGEAGRPISWTVLNSLSKAQETTLKFDPRFLRKGQVTFTDRLSGRQYPLGAAREIHLIIGPDQVMNLTPSL